MNETEAARYIGMSVSYLRNDRCHGPVDGRTPGPRWCKLGRRRVVYLRKDLDAWLRRHRAPRPEETAS